MASDVLNQRSFVSTFFSKEKKKASTHSYLKTKMNRQRRPPDDRHALSQASFSDLFPSHSTGVGLQTSKTAHRSLKWAQKEMSSDLRFQFHFLSVRGTILLSDQEYMGLCRMQLWPTHHEPVPGPFISSEGPGVGECDDMTLQITSLAQIWEIPLPGETSLSNVQRLLLKASWGVGWIANIGSFPMNRNRRWKLWKERALFHQAKPSLRPKQKTLNWNSKNENHGK